MRESQFSIFGIAIAARTRTEKYIFRPDCINIDLVHIVKMEEFDGEYTVKRLRQRGLQVSDFDVISKYLSSIQLPVLEYGYPTNPYTWKQLQTIILLEKDLAKLARSRSQQREYEIFQYCLKREYASVLDYILVTKFGLERRVSDGDGRARAFPPLKDFFEVKKVLVENDFPYFNEDGIYHFLLWKINEKVLPCDIVEAKESLRRKLEVVDTLHWINPPHLQSILDIEHVHILCRVEKGAD